ncbi:MAG: hypothetical protein ACJ79E_03545 [Anaeromyxobacteraceae bacterium]
MLVRLRILWLDLLALAGAIAAVAPLLLTRRPVAARRAPAQPPRVVPLPERRRASPS